MPALANLILIIPDKPDRERDSVAATWRSHGGEILSLGRFWDPPPLDPGKVRLYGPDAFCLVVAQKLALHLVSPPDDAILGVLAEQRGREVRSVPLGEIRSAEFPIFAKPLTPKAFRAGVYTDRDDLLRECRGLPLDTIILSSPVLQIDCEARSFVHDSNVLDCAIYEGTGNLEAARVLAQSMAEHPPCSPVVIDLAHSPSVGWFVLEFNATWGAGLNGCSPERVYAAIAAATCPLTP